MKTKSSIRILTTGAAALIAAALAPSARADFFTYTGGVFTETFDNLGAAGLATTLLTGPGSFPNDGVAPWFAGIVAAGTGNTTAAAVTTTALNSVSSGTVAVNNPAARLFNNGETTTPTDRALGSGNTGGDPVLDLKVKNSATGDLSSMTVSFNTEFYRGGVQATAPVANFGYTLLYSPTGLASSWVSVPYTIPTRAATTSGADLDGNLVGTNKFASTVNFNFPTAITSGGTFFLRFWDTNDATNSPDSNIAIDDLTFSAAVLGSSLTYNLAHAVGGAPTGKLEASSSQYWLKGGNPNGFAANDIANFSQNPAGTALIDVPANIAVGGLNVSNTTGSYSIGGVGQIAGVLTKSNASTLTLTSANALTGITLTDGGTIVATASGALGTGTLTVGTGGGTIQANADQVTGGLSGAGVFTKTGNGTLALTGTGTGTAGITVSAGKLRLDSATGIGDTAGVTLAAGTTFEYNGAAATSMTFSDATHTRVLATGANNVTISNTVAATNQAIIFGSADSLVGSGTITKEGPGTVRIGAAQNTLTSNWVLNGGALELNTSTLAAGTGTITANPTSVVVATAIALPNNITLAGGALGTRTNSTANYAGAVNVTADSFINLKSNSTPTGFQGFGVTGVLSGTNSLTLTGAVPLIANTNAATAFTLKNTANTYSGTINVTSQTFLANAATTLTGNALGASTVNLEGGALYLLDDSTGDNTTVVYGNNVTVGVPTGAGALAGVGTIHADRQLAAGTAVNNTIILGNLSIAGGQSLAITGANGYNVAFAGPATITGAGDATIDTGTATLTLTNGLSGPGGLIKNGASLLTLLGSVSYAGNTAVNGGLLDVVGVTGGFSIGATKVLSGTGNVQGPVSIANGGIVAPGDVSGVGTLSLSDLTLGNSSVQFTWNAGNVGLVSVSNPDALITTGGNGSVTLNFLGQNPTLGAHTLIDYAGTPLTTPQFQKFTQGALFSRIQATLVNNTANTSVDINVTGLKYPIWTGSNSTEWSTATIAGTKNWVLNGGGGQTDFLASDKVVFDDTASAAAPVVDISVADVAPSDVLVDSTKNYTFQGAFGITGATPLVKNNTGKLTISNTNSFTGAVTVNGGTVSVPTITDSGVAGPLGAGTTAIALENNAALEFTGVAGSTNRGITVGALGGTVSAPTGSTLTLAGVVGGTGTLEKKGAGTVVLSGATNAPAAITITAGTLQVGDGTAAGSLGTAAISDNGTLAFNTPAAGLAVPNTITGSGGLHKTGAGSVTLSGAAVANTFTGDTVVDGGTLILSHTTGTDSVGGNVIVNTGGTVAYGTTAGQIANHIPDTATITVAGGTFGGGAGSTLAGPTQDVGSETVASVAVNAGTFLTGRTPIAAPFTVTGTFAANAGTTIVQRGGSLAANAVTITNAATFGLDGGSTTAGQQSRLLVGAGGLHLTDATVSLNNGPSAVTATSKGSEIILAGDVTSTGTTNITRVSPIAAPLADIDLNGAQRTITVAGTLNVGTFASPISVVNSNVTTPGGIIKAGSGNLVLSGTNTYNGDTVIQDGTLTLTGTLSGSANIDVQSTKTFDVTGAAGGFTLGAAQTLKGNGTVVGTTTVGGTLAPGASIGTLHFSNDLTFIAGGIALFEVNKAAGNVKTNDKALVTGALTLAGNLNISTSGLALAQGDTFDLFDATSFTGSMVDISASPGPGLSWDLTNLAVDGSITVVPEPGSVALLVMGSTLLFRRRRQA